MQKCENLIFYKDICSSQQDPKTYLDLKRTLKIYFIFESSRELNTLSKNKLEEIDFYPFKSNPAKFAMTAHILYTKIDNKNVTTFSKGTGLDLDILSDSLSLPYLVRYSLASLQSSNVAK